MDLGISGKRALVFGSSSGIGKGVAMSLIKEGVSTAISSRNDAHLQKVKNEIKAQATISTDFQKPGDSRRAVESANALLGGGPDILVINSGGPKAGLFTTVPVEDWQTSFQLLWLSAIDAIQTALPRMKSQKWGRIVLITSTAARQPIDGLTVSTGLRSGLLGLVKSISREVASSGITVNSVLPGYTRTERLLELNLPEEKILEEVPTRRLADPGEMGDLVTFLCSERASFITGQAIVCDGGLVRGI